MTTHLLRPALVFAALLAAGATLACEEHALQPRDEPAVAVLRLHAEAAGAVAVQLRIDGEVLETRAAGRFDAWSEADDGGGQLILLSDAPLPAGSVTLAHLVVRGRCAASLVSVAGADLETPAGLTGYRLSCDAR